MLFRGVLERLHLIEPAVPVVSPMEAPLAEIRRHAARIDDLTIQIEARCEAKRAARERTAEVRTDEIAAPER